MTTGAVDGTSVNAEPTRHKKQHQDCAGPGKYWKTAVKIMTSSDFNLRPSFQHAIQIDPLAIADCKFSKSHGYDWAVSLLEPLLTRDFYTNGISEQDSGCSLLNQKK